MRNVMQSCRILALLVGAFLAQVSCPGLADGDTKFTPPPESILDSLDEGKPGPTQRTPRAACQQCEDLASRLARLERMLAFTKDGLEWRRGRYSNLVLQGENREIPRNAEESRGLAEMRENLQAEIRFWARTAENRQREADALRAELEACNRRCAQPPPRVSTQRTSCSPCVPIGVQLDELERARKAKEAEVERLSREAQEISGRAMDGKARPGDGSQLQQRRRAIERLGKEIDDSNRESERLTRELRDCERKNCPPPGSGTGVSVGTGASSSGTGTSSGTGAGTGGAASSPGSPSGTSSGTTPSTSTGTSGSHLPVGGGY